MTAFSWYSERMVLRFGASDCLVVVVGVTDWLRCDVLDCGSGDAEQLCKLGQGILISVMKQMDSMLRFNAKLAWSALRLLPFQPFVREMPAKQWVWAVSRQIRYRPNRQLCFRH